MSQFKALVPVAAFALTFGIVAGYSLNPRAFAAREAAPVVTHVSVEARAPLVSPTWAEQPAVMDSSWQTWNNLTDY